MNRYTGRTVNPAMSAVRTRSIGNVSRTPHIATVSAVARARSPTCVGGSLWTAVSAYPVAAIADSVPKPGRVWSIYRPEIAYQIAQKAYKVRERPT